MSNRFYVNGVQIFGNNEMFRRTHDEIVRQGGEWDDVDLILPKTEIKDPQALMDAVEKDSLEYLKKALTEKVWSDKKGCCVKRPFSRLSDKHLLLSDFTKKDVLLRAYTIKGEIRKNAWKYLKWWIEEKRVFSSLTLYLAIQNDVEEKEGKLVLKEGHNIIATMY